MNLTPREIEVLKHLSEGDSNRKIALDLDISEETVKTHISNIYRKVGIPSWANERSWVAIHAADFEGYFEVPRMLNVWIRRNPRGFETFDMEGIEELEEQLKGLEAFKPLDDKEEICAEITGPWGEIRQLLSQPFLKNIWFDPESPRFKQ